MDITKRIIDIREQKRIKQIEIAEKLSIDRQNYSRLEKRGDKLTIEQLKQIAGALGVELNELLGIEVQTVDNERVKELEKRALELEKLNNLLEEQNKELKIIQDENNEILDRINDQLVYKLLKKYQVGHLDLIDTDFSIAKTINLSTVSKKEMHELIYLQRDYAANFHLTKEDKRELINRLMKDSKESEGYKIVLDDYEVISIILATNTPNEGTMLLKDFINELKSEGRLK